jgi:phage baseplate assembly protein W
MVAQDRGLGSDIRLRLRHRQLRPVYDVASDQRRLTTRQGLLTNLDVEVTSGRSNLAQAIVLRLLTPRGELAALGHPDYGSRLHELIGRPNTETTRGLVRLYILESLQMEPRIARIGALSVSPSSVSHDQVVVMLRVVPVGDTAALDVGPFSLELEQ